MKKLLKTTLAVLLALLVIVPLATPATAAAPQVLNAQEEAASFNWTVFLGSIMSALISWFSRQNHEHSSLMWWLYTVVFVASVAIASIMALYGAFSWLNHTVVPAIDGWFEAQA